MSSSVRRISRPQRMPCKKRPTEMWMNEVAFQGSTLIKTVVACWHLPQDALREVPWCKRAQSCGSAEVDFSRKVLCCYHHVGTGELFLQFRLGTAVIRSVSAFR